MDKNLNNQLILALKSYKNTAQFLSVFSSISKQDLIEMLTEILLYGQQFPAAIVMFDIIDLLDDFQQKVQCEAIFVKLMSNFKECKQENIQNHAEIIGALLRRFNKYLSITQQDLFSFIFAPKREKFIHGLILIKEITSLKQGFKYIISHNDHLSMLLYKAEQAIIHCEAEIINALIDKWENNKQNNKTKTKSQQIKQNDHDVNLLITCCLIQLQKSFSDKQKKKVYSLVITQINADKYLEEDSYLLYHYLYFLKNCNNNFIEKREKCVFQKLNKLLKMYEIKQFVKIRDDIQLEGGNLKEEQQELQLYETTIKNSIYLFMIFVNEMEFTKNFVNEMVDCMFSICEHFDVRSQENLGSEPLLDFKWVIENITSSKKRILVNDIVFQKIQKNIKIVGQGSTNEQIPNQVDYSQEEARVLLGTYNMLFFWISNNLDYFRQIESIFCKFLEFHLKNPHLKYYVIKCLYQLLDQAYYFISYNHEYFMDNLIDIFQNTKDFSNNNNSKLVVQVLEIIYQKYDNNVPFNLQYIPRIYQICLKLLQLISPDNSNSVCLSSIQSLICNILKIDKVEFYVAEYFQLSKEIFLNSSNLEQDQGLNTSIQNQDLNSNLPCLSSLANMSMKSQTCRDQDLVTNVKSLLRAFVNQIYSGKYDTSFKIRSQIYEFIQNIELYLFQDNSLTDELFLKLFPKLITDININTNFIVANKNLDSQKEDEEYDQDFDQVQENDQLQIITPNIEILNYKTKAIQLLGCFINVCPKIVMENKKFEIMSNIIKQLTNEREEYNVVHYNLWNLAKMFECVQSYFLQNLPDQYLNNSQDATEENQFLSEQAKVEYTPLFSFTLKQICNVEQLNYESEIEDISYLFYIILKSIDNPTKRTFFQEIFYAIRSFMTNTRHLLSTGIVQWCLLGLKLIYKAYPTQLQNNFFLIWKSLVNYAFQKQKISQYDENEDSINYSDDEEDNNDDSGNDEEEEEEDEEGDGDDDSNNYNDNDDSQSSEYKIQDEQNGKTLKIDTSKIDLQIVSEIIGSVASFVKYDKCVFPIIKDLISQVILNKKYIEQEMVQRNSFYYLNKITRYCFDSIEPNLFKKYYELVKDFAESYKDVTSLNKRCMTENIYTTYAIMNVKFVENKSPSEYTKDDFYSFDKLFSLIPFEGDYTEMKRVIKICIFLLEKNAKIIEQNLYNVTSSILHMIHDPLKYGIKSQNECIYIDFYEKLVYKFPQVKSIAQSIIGLNKGNIFNNQQQILLKLKIV
ncbi:hypothetical protein ABPG74_016563 [Tetrahymena malaccensis]